MTDTLTDAQLASARARTHERINDLIVTPPRRSRKLPALALAATAAAAVAVAFAPGGSPTQPEVATAATVLRDFKPQPLPTLAAGEYYAVRVVQREAEHPEQALDLRYWADADGKGREVTLLDGKVRRAPAIEPPPPEIVESESKPPAGPDWPTEAADLPEYLRGLAHQTIPPGSERREPTTRDYVLAASQMVTDPQGTPPEVLREVFDFLSGLPGMRLVGDVIDPLGRPGKAVAANGDPQIHEGIGVELIVNPETGRPLAMVHYRDGDVTKPWLETIRTEGVTKDTQTLP
ncbi:hypothetical protein OJ998_36280 [Solirubrobacter taibaiensis]|nr:hypothetical protein [Solirubrobacter taibaiensis]